MDVASSLNRLRQRIAAAEAAAGRPAGSVTLLAVSKTFPAGAVRVAHAAGLVRFGENYVQEMVAKAAELADLGLEWHFIGPLQSNKTRPVAETAAWVHSVERGVIAERLSRQRPAHLPPLQICLQVNVSGEASKSGCAPDAVPALAAEVAALPNLVLRGLMCVPEATDDTARLAGQFDAMVRLFETLNRDGFALDTLSMGMSSDLDLAIGHGATMVRIGSALFGARHYPQL